MAPSNAAKLTPPGISGFTPEAVEFNEMTKPGSYITEQGSLLRVPSEALATGHSPRITLVSNDVTKVTRISDDPYAPISKVRELAANADLVVNF